MITSVINGVCRISVTSGSAWKSGEIGVFKKGNTNKMDDDFSFGAEILLKYPFLIFLKCMLFVAELKK